ncbi:MAG: bifunctional glutamate N-acetyltransferase/amino-acid acetyltransferase ArgJ, partial [Syntrophomonadaceae bacterium]|nr:bifunctional glutamate N-acetyltransferase/amino-acid acetyltransferase ArgJ [Syntrophomonadaceae bacterium]
MEAESRIIQVAGGVTAPRGFRASGVEAQIKYANRKDLALIFSERPARAAAVYTRNLVKAAPILVTREHLAGESIAAVVVNAGCANACTGERGMQDAREMAAAAARRLGLIPRQVAVASTGVIGSYLPMERVIAGIERAVAELSPQGGSDAARAIMTTDTCPKETAVSFSLQGKTATIGGMAKGSGMIHPDLATLLVFITTDAQVEPGLLQETLNRSVERSFNRVSVDGDTSTNDMVLMLANGAAGCSVESGEDREVFQRALDLVTARLAQEVARDGEGATRLIEVRVERAASEEEAARAARAVVRSNLVKSAVYGRDANWGRILAAVGYSGIEFDPQRVDIWLGEVAVAEQGRGLAFDEDRARELLGQDRVVITVSLNRGTELA